jgi:hypothetical protein
LGSLRAPVDKLQQKLTGVSNALPQVDSFLSTENLLHPIGVSSKSGVQSQRKLVLLRVFFSAWVPLSFHIIYSFFFQLKAVLVTLCEKLYSAKVTAFNFC